MIKQSPIDDLLLKLAPDTEMGTKKVEALKLLYQIGDDERKTRLHKLLSLSAKKLLNDNLIPGTQVLLPPSPKEACKGDIFLGTVCYGQTPDGKDRELYPLLAEEADLGHHFLISGVTGSGKTNFAYNIAIELANKEITCLIFDWGRTWRSLLSLPKEKYSWVENIRVFTIGRELHPLRWNIFVPPASVDWSNWLGIVTGKALQKSLLGGAGVADVIEQTAHSLFKDYHSGILKKLPNLKDVQKRLAHRFPRGREMLWQQSTERIIRSLNSPSVKELFGSRTPLDIGSILDHKGITILEMDVELPDAVRIYFQQIILHYLFLHYLANKGETENEELRIAVFLEEFQSMAPSKFEQQIGGDIVTTLFREGRKQGIALIPLLQNPSTLDVPILGNVRCQAHMALQARKDIETSAGSMFMQKGDEQYLDLIWRGKAIMKIKGRVNNCLLKIKRAPIQRKITDEELKEIASRWQHQN